MDTDLQVMPNMSYPIEIWDSAVRDTVRHHVKLRIYVPNQLNKRGDKCR